MVAITPITGQMVTLWNPVSTTATTIQTIGMLQKTSTESGIIGPQILGLSPWTTSSEFVYINQAAEPTLITDRSAEGKANIYEYTLITRGIHSDNLVAPPTLYATAKQMTHAANSAVILPLSVEYFQTNFDLLETLLGTATNNRMVQTPIFDAGTSASVGDNRWSFVVPASYDTTLISSVKAVVFGTAGATGSTTFDLYNVTRGYSTLSTKVTISGTATSGTGTVNPTKNEVLTDDLLRVDVDTVTTTAPKGIIFIVEFTAA